MPTIDMMTTPFWCLIIAIIIPYIIAGITGYFKMKQFGSVDAKNPRLQAAKLEGVGARADAAQANAWEALAVFTGAVFIAHLAGADAEKSALAAQLFILFRVLHIGFYIGDIAPMRTASFFGGFACCIWLFVLAA